VKRLADLRCLRLVGVAGHLENCAVAQAGPVRRCAPPSGEA
jgi:hypothetical protein